MSSAATANARPPSRTRPSRSGTSGAATSARDSRARSLTALQQPPTTSARPLPNPRPTPSTTTDPALRKEKSKTQPPEPPPPSIPSPRSRIQSVSQSPAAVKGPRLRTQSQGVPSAIPSSPRVFLSSTERSQATGSGSSEKEPTKSASPGTSIPIASSSKPPSATTITKSSSLPPTPPARSPLRSNSTSNSHTSLATSKSPDKRAHGDHVSSQQLQPRSRLPSLVSTPQHMGKSNPSANPLSNPASKPLSGVKKVASEAGSTDAGEMTASHRSDRNEMDQECGANENGVLVKSLSKPPRSSSVAATITATTRARVGKSENEKTPAPTRQRLHSTTLASSPSSTSSPTLSKSKTSDSKESHTMVRSAIGRSQSASATTTTTIGPRPPSSHKLPAPVSSSSWCTPPKDRIKRHTSVEASSQRPSTAAPSSSSSYKKFPSLSSTLEKSSGSSPARPSTSGQIPSSSSVVTTTMTSPMATPSPRARGRSGTVTQTPPSSTPSTSYSPQHFLSPSPQNSPVHHSPLSSSPLGNSMMFSSGSPLSSFPRSHRSSTASEVSPVHLKRLLAKPAEASGSSAYGSGSESEAIKGVGGGTFHKMQHGSDSEGGYKSAPGAIGDGRHGSGKGELKGRQRWLAEMQKALKVDEDEKQRQEIPQLPSLRLVQSLDTPPSSPPPPLGTSASSAGDSSKFPLTPITVLTTKSKGMSLSELEKVNDKEKRIRNVLKKRPSTGGFSFLRRPGTPSSGKAASSNAQSPIMQSPLPMSPNMLHSPQLHPKSRSPSRNHGKEGSGSSGSPSASNLPPRSLTPAAQLAMAYREQEARRDDLAGSALGHYASPSRSGSRSGNTSASASVISIAAGVMSGPASTSHGKDMDSGRNTNDDGGEPGTPYYTVFGSTTGKVVAVGSPYDAWGQDVDVPWSRGREKSINAGCGGRRGRSLDGRGKEKDGKSGKNGSGPMSGVGKTLSRKISGRFRKGSEVTVDTEVKLEVGELGELGHARDKGWSFGKSQQRRSLRLSIDKFAFTEDIPVPPKPPPKQQSPPPTNEPPPAEETKKKNDPSVLNSGKIWKLMKRISSGALRDRYAEPPPPVPALPKGFSAHPTSTSSQTAQEPKPEGLSRFLSRQSNQSVPCADPPLKKHATAVAKLSATGAVVSAAPRHSLNTSSSSPISDELHSLRFFKGTHSSRSSRSSLFDDVDAPPLPVNSVIAQHIIPPSEFNRGDTSEESVGHEKEVVTLQSKKPFLPLSLPDHTHSQFPSPDDWFIKTPYEEVKQSLPLPPRDRKQKPTQDTPPRAPSPIIPSFSTSAPINDFSPRRSNFKQRQPSSPSVPQTQVAALSPELGSTAPLLQTPPPRPSRSRDRPSPNASRSSSRVTSPVRNPERPLPPLRDTEAVPDPPRKSFGSRSTTSTFRLGRGRSPSPSAKRKTMVYRELRPAQKSPMLTDKEKDDRWNDLLERSARAGGTLHIGGGDLPSDRMSTLSLDSAMSS